MTAVVNTRPDELRELVKRVHGYSSNAPIPKLDVNGFEDAPEPRDLIAVDGSYTFLFSISNSWLGVVRACAVHYARKDSGYKLLETSLKEEPILVSRNEELMKDNPVLLEMLDTMGAGSDDFENRVINGYRAYLEESLALEITKVQGDAIIALDGALYKRGCGKLAELVELCDQRSNFLVGISKDSTTHMFGSLKTDEELLNDLDAGMAYVKAKKQRGVIGDTYFAKLHPDSRKWFRVDVGNSRDPEEVFPTLSSFSKSQLCLGYPYPLLEAHRLVVLVRHFQELYEHEVLSAAMELGMPIGHALDNMTRWEGERKGAFHEYLDRIVRVMR